MTSQIVPDMAPYSDAMARSSILSHLSGRYLAQRSINRKRAQFFAEDLGIPSAYKKAIEFFINKDVITKKEFGMLEADVRRKSFTLAADSRKHLLARIKEFVAAQLAGELYPEVFAADLFGFFVREGITPKNPHYYELVLQNAIQESLAAGKDAIFEQAEEDEFPLMQFLTVGDERVRGEHAAIDGFTAPRNDPIWKRLRPPLSHSCRCTRTLVHKDEGLKPWPKSRYPTLQGRGFEFVN